MGLINQLHNYDETQSFAQYAFGVLSLNINSCSIVFMYPLSTQTCHQLQQQIKLKRAIKISCHACIIVCLAGRFLLVSYVVDKFFWWKHMYLQEIPTANQSDYWCMLYSKHIYSYLFLTTVCLLSSTTNKSLRAPDTLLPPNSAALFSATWVRVKKLHGGGGCPVIFGELHSPGDTCMYIIYVYTLQWNLDYPNFVCLNLQLSRGHFLLWILYIIIYLCIHLFILYYNYGLAVA